MSRGLLQAHRPMLVDVTAKHKLVVRPGMWECIRHVPVECVGLRRQLPAGKGLGSLCVSDVRQCLHCSKLTVRVLLFNNGVPQLWLPVFESCAPAPASQQNVLPANISLRVMCRPSNDIMSKGTGHQFPLRHSKKSSTETQTSMRSIKDHLLESVHGGGVVCKLRECLRQLPTPPEIGRCLLVGGALLPATNRLPPRRKRRR